LIYVWAVEQDELSKRKIPTGDEATLASGKDVVVPWVLSREIGNKDTPHMDDPRILNRYYHMFSKGELRGLVEEAARDLNLQLGPSLPDGTRQVMKGVEVVQDGWERSNYYVELRCWEN
jgi:tRNA (uracil-5-)-methyltransferase TRM9